MGTMELQLDVPTVRTGLSSVILEQLQQMTKFTVDTTDFYINQPNPDGTMVLHHGVAEDEVIFYETSGSGFVQPDGSHVFSETVPGKKVQFAQNFNVPLSTVSNGTVTGFGDFTVKVVLRMWVDPISFNLGVDTITVAKSPPNSDMVGAALVKLIEQNIRPLISPIPTSLLGTKAPVGNTGVSVDEAGLIIAIRVEYGLGEDPNVAQVLWTDFYAGNFSNRLSVGIQSGHVSLSIDAFSIEQLVTQSYARALASRPDKIKLHWGPETNWTPTASGDPHLDVYFNGDIIGACYTAWDMNFDFHGDVNLSLANSPNVLQIDSNLSWTANFWDELGCALVFGLLEAFVGAVVGGIAGPVGAGIGAGVGFAVGVVTTYVAPATYVPTIPTPPSCTQKGTDITCTFPLNVPPDPFTKQPFLKLKSVAGAPDGPVFFIALSIGALTVQSAKVGLSDVGQFQWRSPGISCAHVTPHILQDLMANVEQYAITRAYVDLVNLGQGQLVVKSVERISPDPAGAFGPGSISITNYANSCRVEINTPFNAAYMAAPYPCVLLILTNGGVITASLNPIPALDADALAAIQSEATAMVDSCEVAGGRPYDLKWLIDPAPDGEEPGLRLTQVQVRGLQADDTITLGIGEATNTAVSAASAARGFAEASLLTSSSVQSVSLGRQARGGNLGVAAARTMSSGEGSGTALLMQSDIGSAKRSTTVRQIAIVECGRVSLGSSCLQISSYLLQNQPYALGLTSQILAHIDLSNPYRPRLVRVASVPPGMKGFTIQPGNRLLVWGEGGLFTQDVGESRFIRFDDEPIAGISSIGQLLAVARSGRIDLLEQGSLRQVGHVPCEGIQSITSTSRHLVSLGTSGLEAWQLNANQSSLSPTGRLERSGVSEVIASSLVSPRTAVCASGPAIGGVVVDFSAPEKPQAVAEYPERPWFVDAVAIGQLLLIQHNSDDDSVLVATLGPTRTAVDLTADGSMDPANQTSKIARSSGVSGQPGLQSNEALEATLIIPSSLAGTKAQLQLPSGQTIPLQTEQAIVGRGNTDTAEAAAIDLSAEQEKATVSRLHAQLTRVGDHVEIEDLQSANGTLLNSQKLLPGQRYPLQNGDVIEFGKVRCVFQLW